jgi:hypothetical protein
LPGPACGNGAGPRTGGGPGPTGGSHMRVPHTRPAIGEQPSRLPAGHRTI